MEQKRIEEIDAILDAALNSLAFVADLSDEEYKAYLGSLTERKDALTDVGWAKVASNPGDYADEIVQLQKRHNLISSLRSQAKRADAAGDADEDKTEDELKSEKAERDLATILKLMAGNGFTVNEYTLIETKAAAGRAEAQVKLAA